MTTSSRFALGRIVATPGALDALAKSGQSPAHFLLRHASGDWGVVSAQDKRLNDEAVRDGSRIMSAYRTSQGSRIWVITEADRSSTCVLLPGEY
jgi:hypothetical protein